MFPHIATRRRSFGCVAGITASVIVTLSLAPLTAAIAQQAQSGPPADQTVQLPAISVTAAPPSQPGNQASGDATVVSPTTTVMPSDQSASSVTVITSADIESRQLRTVPDALATVPGLNIAQYGGSGGLAEVYIRGTNSNHVKVLIDGIDVTDPSSSNAIFDFGQLLTGDIERIEVLRGPQSGLYGSDAIGGVISITTKSGSGPPKVTASFEGGSFGTTNERVGLSGSQGDFNYAFNIQHFQSTSTPVMPTADVAPGQPRNNNFYDNWTYSTKLGEKVSDSLGLNFVARYTDSKLNYSGDDFYDYYPLSYAETIPGTQVDRQFFGRAEAVWSPFAGFKNFIGVNYTDEWSWNFDPNVDNGCGYCFPAYLYVPPVLPPSTNLGTRVKEDYRGEWQFAPGQSLLFGAEDMNETIRTNSGSYFDPTFTYQTYFTTNAERRNDAGWLELQNQVTKQFSIVSNVRYDANEDFGDHTTYRVAPVYIVPITDTKLKASYGTGFKAPSLQDLYVNYYSFYFVANPDLKPEESAGWDAGFEQPLANDRFRFGSTYFRNDIRNLIVGVPAPNYATTFDYMPGNVDVASMFGAENFVAWRVTNNLNLRADYTYTVAKDDLTDQQLLKRPKNKASLTATWQATDRLSLTSTLLYVGSWWDMGRELQDPTLVKAPGFTTVNLAANYALTDDLMLFGRIDNLFNKQYQDPFGYMRTGFGAYAGIRLTLGGAPASGTSPSTAAPANALPPAPSPRSQGTM